MNGYHVDIEKVTEENKDFRRVLYTTPQTQLVVMSVKDEIPLEKHSNTTQFIRIEKGYGVATIDGEEYPLYDGICIVIPPGSKHKIQNLNPKEDLKLYTLYSPPEHKDGTVQHTK